MNRSLLALLIAAAPAALLAQLPEYVPTDNLIGWYPLDAADASDYSGNGNDGVAENVTLESDRFGNLNGAVGFQGQNCCGQTDEILQHILVDGPLINLGGNYTIACWFTSHNIDKYQQCLFNTVPHTGFVVEYNNEHAPDVTSVGLGPGDAYWNTLYQHGPFSAYNQGQWYHVAFTKENNHYSLYIDGVLDWEATYGFAAGFHLDVGMRFGAIGGGHQIMNGAIDDCGIWNRTLGLSEIMGLYLYEGDSPDYGCMDSQACNFDDNATADDGTCEYGCLYCGEGTVWDPAIGACVSICEESAGQCGLGTVWDPFNQECIVAIPADIDHDGCVTINDLLGLLSVHGTCPAVPFADPCADENTLLYDGHAYDLISIGDQCWFAENLRSAHYANGDAIPSDIQDSLLWATEGAQTYFLEDSVFLEERGRMYNGFAVLDVRGLCPTGWHVPSDTDFIQLEEATGLSEVDLESTAGDRGCNLEIGGAWKSQSGWYPGEQGTDLWGLSVKPSGYFLTWEGFGNAYTNSEFWTSTPYDATRLWRRQVPADSGCLFRGWWKMGVGSAIRCVKD